MYPFIYPKTPHYPKRVFDWLVGNITLISLGMGSIGFRHNLMELKELMGLEKDMNFKLLRPYVEKFEILLIEQYNKNQKES